MLCFFYTPFPPGPNSFGAGRNWRGVFIVFSSPPVSKPTETSSFTYTAAASVGWNALALVATVVVEVLGGRLQQLQTGDVVVVQQLQHVLGVGVDLDDVLLQGGHGGHVVVTTLALLLLQLDGDAAHLRVAQTAHQMRDVSGCIGVEDICYYGFAAYRLCCCVVFMGQQLNLPGDLVAQGLGRDDGNFLADTLVGMEVHGQSSVVLLDDDLGGLLDSLSPDATLNAAKGARTMY